MQQDDLQSDGPQDQGLGFALLWHTLSGDYAKQTGRKSHFDLLLQKYRADSETRSLEAWSLMQNPFFAEGERLLAERIADHRTLYLDYEGQISGGRGSVQRIADGRLDWLQQEQTHCRAAIEGYCTHPRTSECVRIQGELRCEQLLTGRWQVGFLLES